MKKLASLALAFVLALALAVPAFAAGNTITISDAADGHTYEAYQIFSGGYSGGKLVNVTWGDGVNSGALLTALKDDDEIGSTFTSCGTAADVAKAIDNKDIDFTQKFAAIVAQNKATPAGTSAEGTDKYTISGLDNGYYLVMQTGTVGTGEAFGKYIIKLVGENVLVDPKTTTVPTPDKTIGESDTTGSYNIGDDVPYTLRATLPIDFALYETYYLAFNDTLSAGLTYNNDAKVFVGNTEVTSSVTVTASGQNLKVEITDVNALAGDPAAGTVIKVTYTAELNGNAVVGGVGNANTLTLEYSNNPNSTTDRGTSVEKKTYTYTFAMNGLKVDGADNTTPLADAYFVLQRNDNKYATVDGSGKVNGWVDDEPATGNIKSGANGRFTLTGLAVGSYKLIETAAPTGYNLLADPVVIEVTAVLGVGDVTSLTVTMNGDDITASADTGVFEPTVANNSGAVLPGTGGMGTTIFYTMGGLLTVGAVVLLVTKKRMHNVEG